MIEMLLCYIVFGAFILYTFIKGVQIGQKSSNNEKIEIKNPIGLIKEHRKISKDEKEMEQESLETETTLENINNYDGTGLGQKDI